MPFNKGDFTQQGVNGHVNSTVRLNEKRLVNIDLTSNEEAEGCTITGTVTDLLNNKVYGIGAGVSGNIEITENGENINVAPYATATVNVAGGSDDNLLKLSVTIKNDDESATNITESVTNITMYGYYISNQTIRYAEGERFEYMLQPGESITFDLLYNHLEMPGVEYANVTDITVSDIVNLTLNDTEPTSPYYYATSNTENSSITLTCLVQK